MKATNQLQLGKGIYTVPDLALILHLPQHKVRRWLADFYDIRLGDLYEHSYSRGTGKDKTTNFLTLIEFYVFYMLREQGLGVNKILEAHKHMSKELKTKYPFASYKLLVNAKNILYGVDDNTWVHADKTNQIVIEKLIRDFFTKVHFSEKHIAEKFWPLGKDHSIVVDPHHQFGQPVISGTNVNASTLYSMYESGESLPTLGILYDLTEQQVKDAIAFCKSAAA